MATTPVDKLIGEQARQKEEFSTSVALQAWTNDKFVAAEILVNAKIEAVKELFYRLTADHALAEKAFHELAEKTQQQQFGSSKDAVVAALAAAEKAVTKSESDNDKWRQNANEWRAAMLDREKNFVSRGEYDTFKSHIEESMRLERSRADKVEGKGVGLNAGWVFLVGAVGLILTITAIISMVITLRNK